MKKVIIFDTPLSIEKKIGRLYTWQDVPRFWEFQLSRNRRVVLGTGNGFLAKFQVTMLGNLPAIRNYSRLDIHQAEMYLLLYKLSPAESYKYLRRLGRHKRNNNTTKKRRRKKTKKNDYAYQFLRLCIHRWEVATKNDDDRKPKRMGRRIHMARKPLNEEKEDK